MKAASECYQCLRRLVYGAAGLAAGDEELKAGAIREGLTVVSENFSTDALTIAIATEIHRLVKEITKNPNPYHIFHSSQAGYKRRFLQGMVFRENRSQLGRQKATALWIYYQQVRPAGKYTRRERSSFTDLTSTM